MLRDGGIAEDHEGASRRCSVARSTRAASGASVGEQTAADAASVPERLQLKVLTMTCVADDAEVMVVTANSKHPADSRCDSPTKCMRRGMTKTEPLTPPTAPRVPASSPTEQAHYSAWK